jgi:predicted Zn finger-like uncharacterized protein
MNPMLNYSPTATHKCKCCDEEFEVDYSKLSFKYDRVRCPHCKALYRVDTDAEFIGGVWTDKTKLYRVCHCGKALNENELCWCYDPISTCWPQ